MTLSEIRAVEIGILDALMAFCEKHELTCWLNWGTLLGAARHKGFIPWDDDIDVSMPAEDHRRLIEIIDSGEDCLPSPYRLSSSGIGQGSTSSHHIWFTKVYDMTTRVEEPYLSSHLKKRNGGNEGCWIDVMVLMGAESEEAYVKMYEKAQKYREIIKQATTKPGVARNPIRSLVYLLRHLKARFVGEEWALQRYYELINSQPSFRETQIAADSDGPWIPLASASFLKSTTLEFEGKHYPVPSGWEDILAIWFGDWHILPPKDEQIRHDFDAYWR